MSNKAYTAIFILITLSMLGVIGMQYYWLDNQFNDRQEELERDTKKAIKNIHDDLRGELGSSVSIDEDNRKDLDLYYTNADSTFTFMAESLVKKRNLDGSTFQRNDSVSNFRLQQLRETLAHLETNNPIAAEDISETFIILYGYESKEKSVDQSWHFLVEQFSIDSLIYAQLLLQGVDAKYHFGVYSEDDQKWDYLSNGSDSLVLAASPYNGTLFSDKVYLSLQNPKTYLLRNMLYSLLHSAILISVILGSFFYMMNVIWKQKELSEIKTDFINNMTHEFKTPLATIAFAAANIDNPKVIKEEEKVRQFTAIIKEENKRMNRQVEQVLSAAIADKKAFKLKKENIDVHSLIRDLTTNLILQLNANNGSLKTLLTAKSSTLYADKLHIGNMISNIIDNAQKYSPNTTNIVVETANVNGGITITITDKGMGMSKETVKKIFDRFYRVPTGNIHNIKGFGLGLSYAKAVAEQHGGDISVSSKLNQGSSFSIFLPFNDTENAS